MSNIIIRDAARLRGLYIRITMAGDIEIAAEMTGQSPAPSPEPEPPAKPDLAPAGPPPPDGVCVARSAEAFIAGREGIDIACPFHGVASGVACPSQSPEPNLPQIQQSKAEPIAVGQFRADTRDPSVAAVEIVEQGNDSAWKLRIIATGQEAWFSESDVAIFWPTIAPAPTGDEAQPKPPAPQYLAVGQRWEAGGSDSESVGHAIEIVEHDNGRDPDVWKVRAVPSGDMPDSWCSSEQIRARWPVFVEWVHATEVACAHPGGVAPTLAQMNDLDELPKEST